MLSISELLVCRASDQIGFAPTDKVNDEGDSLTMFVRHPSFPKNQAPMTLCRRCGMATSAQDRGTCSGCYSRELTILRQYNLSVERFWAIFGSQDKACALCKTPMFWRLAVVDHDHTCCPRIRGKGLKPPYTCGECVRGILCEYCNTTRMTLFDAGEPVDLQSECEAYVDRYQRRRAKRVKQARKKSRC